MGMDWIWISIRLLYYNYVGFFNCFIIMLNYFFIYLVMLNFVFQIVFEKKWLKSNVDFQ